MSDVIYLSNGEETREVLRHCKNCVFFAHQYRRAVPGNNACAQGSVTPDQFEQYNAHLGCPVFKLGGSPVLDERPEWEGWEVVGEGDLFDHAEEDLEKAYNPNQPRGANGQWVTVGGQYTHPQWGKVTVDSVSGGQAQVSYRNQSGQHRVRQVNVSDLAAVGGTPAPKPVQAPPPPPVSAQTPSSPAAQRVLAAIAQLRPALQKTGADLKRLFPNDKVVTREKTVQSALRDAAFIDKRNPGSATDPAALPDLVGARVVFPDNAALLAGAAKFRLDPQTNVVWSHTRGIVDPGARDNKPANEGYYAIHQKTGGGVEVQMMTQRMEYFTETTHNVFDKWELRDQTPGAKAGQLKPEVVRYMEDLGRHYNLLDSGQPSQPPTPPAVWSGYGPRMYNDPLLKKELTEMIKDSMYDRMLRKTQIPDEVVPVVKDEELAALAAGQPWEVADDDDHVAHLRRHLNDKAVVLGKALRGNQQAQKSLTALEAHINAHRAKAPAQFVG